MLRNSALTCYNHIRCPLSIFYVKCSNDSNNNGKKSALEELELILKDCVLKKEPEDNSDKQNQTSRMKQTIFDRNNKQMQNKNFKKSKNAVSTNTNVVKEDEQVQDKKSLDQLLKIFSRQKSEKSSKGENEFRKDLNYRPDKEMSNNELSKVFGENFNIRRKNENVYRISDHMHGKYSKKIYNRSAMEFNDPELVTVLDAMDYQSNFKKPGETCDYLSTGDISNRLNIFQQNDEEISQPDLEKTENIMDIIDLYNYRQLNNVISDTQFHEYIQYTRDKKMWKYPINNDQDSEELQVGFNEHVFTQQYLTGRLPTTGPVGQFMSNVCVGLSQSPHLTVKQKKDHIAWFESYLLKRLDKINAAIEKNIEDKNFEEILRNK